MREVGLRLGYIRRRDAKEGGRARIVRFTRRGHAARAKIHEILAEIETEWQAALGEKEFNRLKKVLCEVWVSDLVP